LRSVDRARAAGDESRVVGTEITILKTLDEARRYVLDVHRDEELRETKSIPVLAFSPDTKARRSRHDTADDFHTRASMRMDEWRAVRIASRSNGAPVTSAHIIFLKP
jgi:hypothetical protein